MKMMSNPEDELTHIKMNKLTVVQRDDKSVDEYLHPEFYPGLHIDAFISAIV